MKLIHIGTLVKDIDAARASYKTMMPQAEITDTTYVSSQGVNVCFVRVADGVDVELIAPVDDTSVVAGLVKKGVTYYHAGYAVNDFDAAVTRLTNAGFRQLNVFDSEAFHEKRCSFFMSPEMHLIEIIEE